MAVEPLVLNGSTVHEKQTIVLTNKIALEPGQLFILFNFPRRHCVFGILLFADVVNLLSGRSRALLDSLAYSTSRNYLVIK